MMDILEDEFFSWDNTLNRRAVRALVERHREEYEELSGKAAADRIAQLERQVHDTLRAIETLRSANPDGVSVPALTQTANNLVKENDELRELIRTLERGNKRLKEDNRKLREMLADA
jgi:hypothetical protein